MQTELDILKEAYTELEIERDALKRDVERKAKKLAALADPQGQILELERKLEMSEVQGGILLQTVKEQERKLEDGRELARIGMEALNKIMEESE